MDSAPADPIQNPSAAAPPAPGPARPQGDGAFHDALARARRGRAPVDDPNAAQSSSDPAPARSPARRASDKHGSSGPTDLARAPVSADAATPAKASGDATVLAKTSGGAAQLQCAAEPAARPAVLHHQETDDASATQADGAFALVAGPGERHAQGGGEVAAKSFASLAEQAPAAPTHSPAGVTVQFPDSGWAVSGLDVNVLPDGAVDVVLSVDRQALHAVSDQLDRLKRRLEAKGVSLAGIRLDSGEPMAMSGDQDR